MKIKGITFWEQHVEHFVLALAVLIFVVLTALQFVGDPNAVQVGGKSIGPGEVDQLLQDHARKIQSQISPDAGAPDIPAPTPALAKFQAARAASISPGATLVVGAPGISPVAGPAATPIGGALVVATVPPPIELKTRQFVETLSAELVAQHEALAAKLPNAPFDITWITVFGNVDLGSLVKQWTTDDPNGARALPPKWHDGRVDPIDVKLQRQELLDADQWSEPIIIGSLPGQLTFREELKERIDRAMRDQIIQAVADPAGRNQILQPEFFIGAAAAWEPAPLDDAAHDAAPKPDDLVADLNKRLASLKKERERIAAKLKDNNCPEVAPPEQPPAKKPPRDGDKGGGDKPGGGPPGPPGGGLGGGMAGGGRDPAGGDGKPDDAQCKRLRKALKAKDDQIARVEAELKKLLPDAPPQDQAQQQDAVPAPMPDIVNIWAHDINIEPGKTYRYRLIVEVYNPLFARVELMPAQKPLGEQFTIASLPSEWTEPRLAKPLMRVYIADARPVAQVGPLGGIPLGNATAEVYRWFGGRWWLGVFTAQPGDRIGKVVRAAGRDAADQKPALSIDYSTDWFVLDVIEEVGSQAPNEQPAAALVLIQSLNGKDLIEVRYPRIDVSDAERQHLREEVRLAELANAVAKAP